MTLAPLRPHQTQSLDSLRQALLQGDRRVVLQAPTGFGKTVVAAHIVSRARQRDKRVVFCVPSIGLVDQTFERFVGNGIEASDMGVIQSSHPWRRPHAPVQIATAQTLARRELPLTDLVIVDEAHMRFSVYDQWMQACPDLPFVGLTATPWAKGLGKVYQRLVKSISLGELIEQGFLSPFRVYAPTHPDLTGVRTVAGDYHEGDLAKVMDQPTLTADIVRTWLDRGEDRPTLCFAVDRNHAKALADQFRQFGIPTAYVDAYTPREERDQIGKDLGAGKIRVVCNVGCLTTGIDWDVRCLILARPTKSEMLFVQIIGRALRTADGKADAIILDHSDTHQRLGFVTDIDHDELCDGKPKPKVERKAKEQSEGGAPLPLCCPSCSSLMVATVHVCGACGFDMAAMRRKTPEVAEGELIQFSGKQKPAKRKGATQAIQEMGKQQVYSQLLTMAAERNRSQGWVAHTYRDIFGVWPRGMGDAPAAPCDEVRRYVRHKDIRWARSHANHVGAA